MGKYSNLGKNTVLIFIGSLGSKLLTILMLPFYTSWLSVNDYGNVDLIATYSSLIMSVVTLCITDSIFRFPKNKSIKEQRAYFTTGLCIVFLSLIITGLLYYIVLRIDIFGSLGVFERYAGYIYAFLVLNFLQLYLQQFSRSIDRMQVYVISGIVLTLITATSSLLLIPQYGVNGYLIAQYLGCIFSCLFIAFKINIISYFHILAFSQSTLMEMLRYSIPMIPNATLWWILGASNRIFIEYYHGVNEVGIFAVANKFPSMIIMVFNAFFLSWQISVLEEFNKKDFIIFYNKIFKTSFLVLICLVILLSLFSYTIISIFVDVKFINSWVYIPFLSMASAISSLSLFVGTIFMATKKTVYFLTTSLWGSFLCFALNFILIPKYGLWGATFSLICSHSLILYLRINKTAKYADINKLVIYWLQIVLVLAMGFIIVYIHNIFIKTILTLVIIMSMIYINRNFIKNIKLKSYIIKR